MKSLFSILLSMLMLISSMGYASTTHYCGGVAVETTFSIGQGNPSCGMEEISQNCEDDSPIQAQVGSRQCCENGSKILEIDDTVRVRSITSTLFIALSVPHINLFSLPISIANETKNSIAEYPPPISSGLNIQVLHQSFLI